MAINSVTLVGRAGRDPEVRYFESGSIVANLTIAVNRRSRQDEPDWFNLEIWGKQAQVAADYVKKGSLIGVTGRFKLDQWKDKKTGEKKKFFHLGPNNNWKKFLDDDIRKKIEENFKNEMEELGYL